jgi:hypothetical protein
LTPSASTTLMCAVAGSAVAPRPSVAVNSKVSVPTQFGAGLYVALPAGLRFVRWPGNGPVSCTTEYVSGDGPSGSLHPPETCTDVLRSVS